MKKYESNGSKKLKQIYVKNIMIIHTIFVP